MIRVCIVEDQTLVRQGFRSLLELTQDMKVVAEAHDGEEALSVIRKAKPDVVLLDIQLPKLNGIEVLKTLKDSNQLPPTLILTTFDDDNLVLEGIRAGARGFLLKDVTLKTAHRGHPYAQRGGHPHQAGHHREDLTRAGAGKARIS